MGDLTDHFSRSEFACQCGCGSDNISADFVDDLESVRNLLGRGMRITSGVRCSSHNKQIGGVATSAHVTGKAADIACSSSRDRFELLPLLLSGFARVGIGRHFIHVDNDESKPQEVCFDYYKSSHVA